MIRDTAALDHAIKTLHGKMRVKKREIEALQCAPAPESCAAWAQHTCVTARLRARPLMRRQRRHAELAGEGKYLKAQYDLQEKYSEQGTRAQLQEHEACVKQQIKEAEAERKEVRGRGACSCAAPLASADACAQADQEYSTYMSTKFGARGVPVEIGIASKELFEDNTLSLSDLAERLAKAQ